MPRFVLNETSYHGKGAIQNLVPEINARGFKKVFVVTDPDLVKFGVSQKVTSLLEESNVEYVVFSKVQANPTIQNVLDGVESFKQAQADCIVAIGGGSAIDAAKVIGARISNPKNFEEAYKSVLEIVKSKMA